MLSELATEGEALRLFFTEDFYFVDEQLLPYEAADPQPVTDTVSLTKQIDFTFLGKNKRNILILVNDQNNDVSDETGRELLRKIVKSINLTADDFALLNYARYNTANYEQLKSFFNIKLLFAFGVSPQMLGLTDSGENTIIQDGDVKFIFSAPLPELNNDPNGKKALWGCLKNLNLQ